MAQDKWLHIDVLSVDFRSEGHYLTKKSYNKSLN